MNSPEGICTEIKSIINEMKESGNTVFSTKEIEEKAIERTDIRNADSEWKDHIILSLYIAAELSELQMRSILRGKGYYTGRDTDNPVFLNQLFKNSENDKATANAVNIAIAKKKDNMMDNQIYIDGNAEEFGGYLQNPSAEDVMNEIMKELGIKA